MAVDGIPQTPLTGKLRTVLALSAGPPEEPLSQQQSLGYLVTAPDADLGQGTREHLDDH